MPDSRVTGFELPPRTVDERDRRLIVLEAAEELRELEVEVFDRELDKAPAHVQKTHGRIG